MEELIFLLSENKKFQEMVQGILEKDGLKTILVDRQQLVAKIYQTTPAVILIDIASYSLTALLTIQSTLSIEYVPTICLMGKTEPLQKAELIKDSLALPMENLSSLCLLVRQAMLFTYQHKKLTQTYDTLDIMDEELKHTVDYYNKALPEYENQIIALYLKAIYLDNTFLYNQPKGIWVIEKGPQIITASLFKALGDEVNHEVTLHFPLTEALIFKDFVETGFIRNFDRVEYSDANSIGELLPQELLAIDTPLNNVAGFGINRLVLVGYDYNDQVSKYEMNILKALAIKVDLMNNVKKSLKDVEEAFVYAMNAIARAAEGKDDLTGHHIKRVNLFTKVLADALQLGIEFTSQLEIAAQMHDVGKIYIDDAILSKPGKLTDEEFEEMKKHTLYGQRIIGDSGHLLIANEIARSHHEKFDGTGYPDGKMGEEIPLSARIVSLADVYDALRSKRSYKSAFSHEQTYDIIVNGDGRVEPTHFDPEVLDAFKRVHLNFNLLYNQYSD